MTGEIVQQPLRWCGCVLSIWGRLLQPSLVLGFSWPVNRVTICSRFSGTAPIKNTLSCCQTMCPTMRPDIFMENVVSLLIIFSISLTGLSFHGTQRPLCLGWAVHPSYSVCESPLMSLHLCRAQPAFSNHLQKPSFSHLLNCCYTLPSI